MGSYAATEMWDRNVFRPTPFSETDACPALWDFVRWVSNISADTQAYYTEGPPPPPPVRRPPTLTLTLPLPR